MKLFIHLEIPYYWAKVNVKNEVIDSGILTSLDNFRVATKVTEVIGVAPGQHIVCHSVDIPGKRRNHISAALPFALEDKVSEDIENLHFKLLSWQSGESARALVVAKQKLLEWLESFRDHGIALDAIIPDYLLLPQNPKGDVTIAEISDAVICVRDHPYGGLSLDSIAFSYWWESLGENQLSFAANSLSLAKRLTAEGSSTNISHWEIGSNFSEWLKHFPLSRSIESLTVLDGHFTPAHRKKGTGLIKVSAGLLLIVGMIYSGLLFYEDRLLTQQNRQLDQKIRSLFEKTFQGEPYLGRPKEQVEALIRNANAGQQGEFTFQILMSSVTATVPKFGAVVEEISYRDDSMIVLCTVKDLSSLDRIRQAFEQGNMEAKLVSSGAKDGKITGRFKVSAG